MVHVVGIIVYLLSAVFLSGTAVQSATEVGTNQCGYTVLKEDHKWVIMLDW
jgi:hypothetical protein